MELGRHSSFEGYAYRKVETTMRSASIISAISALIMAGVLFACATGDTASGETGDNGTDTDSGVTTIPPAGDTDSGAGGFVAPKDGGGVVKKDSGTGGGTDSGSTGGGTDSGSTGGGGNDDCTGTQSAGLKTSYSSACTKSLGAYNWGPCTSGNGDCAALTAMNPQLPGPLCCFTPPGFSTCDVLYGPSCLPK